jgi:hypothetical protein
LCIPFFCFGLICCIPAFAVDNMACELKAVIAYYTAHVLARLRSKVDREQGLFLDACSAINKTVPSAAHIVPRLRLIDVIRLSTPTLSVLFKDISMPISFTVANTNPGHTKYIADVYDEYVRLGGNSSVVIYGLPEYLAIVIDPSSTAMEHVYGDIVRDSQLRRMIESHKELAGF